MGLLLIYTSGHNEAPPQHYVVLLQSLHVIRIKVRNEFRVSCFALTLLNAGWLETLPILSLLKKMRLYHTVFFCLRVSAPRVPFVSFSLFLFCFLIENTSAVGFLSLHIVLLRKISLFLMSSVSLALSLRQSTHDLLAFDFLC